MIAGTAGTARLDLVYYQNPERSISALDSPLKGTKSLRTNFVSSTPTRQRRENAGRRLISKPDMESKHPIIAAARLK